MSSSVSVYAVSIDQLKQAVGSGDLALIFGITETHSDFFASINEIDEDAERTCAQAAAELIHDDISGDAPGYLYGYAMEAICSYLSEEPLANICPIVGTSEWIDQVDAALDDMAVPLSIDALVYRGCPIPIPEPNDYPFIGVWTAQEIAEAKTALQNAEPTGPDAQIAETLQQIREWIDMARQQPDASIIGFLS